MDNLIIENPVKLTDTSFKITINGKDFEYGISEEKDIDAVIGKLEKWISRGEESFGGLYDYMKRTFKLIGEYEEPIVEPVEEITDEPELVDIPSDIVDIDEPVANQLDINIDIDEKEVQVQINEWSAKFNIVGTDDSFTDMLTEYINDEMTLSDRTALIIELAKSLEANDIVDFYNLINLILDTGVDIINSFEEVEEEKPADEEPIDFGPSIINEPVSINEPTPLDEPFIQEESEQIGEDSYQLDDIEIPTDTKEPVEDEEALTLDSLINNDNFLEDLVKLDLSLFEITHNETDEKIYFIGGINNIGNKFSLSYTTEPPIELLDQFDDLKDKEVCLNNIEDLNMVVDYINKLLDIVYNKEMRDMEDNNE